MPRPSPAALLLAACCLAMGVLGAGATPGCASASRQSPADEDVRRAISAARDRVFPALVNIQTISVSYWGGKETKGGSVGSGTIISPDGLVLTNQHVVDDGKSFRVTLADRQEVPATLVGEDPLTDLAVLRIDVSQLKGGKALPAATFADSDTLLVGDYVMAMGSPFALSRSVTLGIVSNTERVFTSRSGDDLADQEFDFASSSDIFTRWIQHDALINPGNSGGPLINLRGEVVGVNTRGGAAMGFAVPANLARSVARQLIENGSVTRSTIGVALKSIKRSGHSQGVLLNSVDEDGPAHKAGLHAGDVLLSIDGRSVNAPFPEDIPLVGRSIADLAVGSKIAVTYRDHADGSTRSTVITTERLMRDKGDEAALRLWGVSARQITDRLARSRKLDSLEGAFVIGVRSGGPAAIAEPAIQAGDVIKRVGEEKVADLAGLVARYRAISDQDPAPEWVVIEFDRKGKDHLTIIKPRPDKPDDPPREVPKAWIGVATQPVLRELSRQIGLSGTTGFRVTRVYPGTLAAKAGLKTGDIITSLNGDRLSPRGMQDAGMFQRRVRQLPMDQPARLGMLREGNETELTVELERTRIGPEEALRDTNTDFELTVRELTFFDLDDNRWEPSTQGVIVVNAESAGWADLAGLYAGDLVQQINTSPITDLASYRKVMEALAEQQPERVTFVVLRGSRTQFKFAEPQWKPTAAPAAPAR